MDLKINREMLSFPESIYDGLQEQSVELDYILPDYYPDIFKLVKCCVTPSVVSHNVSGGTLSYELLADIRILYCSENSPALHCISQKLTFSKSLKLSENDSRISVSLTPKTDHINCRVVNKRRIDMRGAVSVKIKASTERTHEVICDIFGMNAQSRKLPIEFASKRIDAFKTLTVSENLAPNASAQPIMSIIRASALPIVTDKRIVANKLIIKGEAKIQILYSTENGLENLLSAIPFSQIADMPGLDEEYSCRVKADTASCDVTVAPDSEENSTLKCELRINLYCHAVKSQPSKLVTDVYSTTYPCEFASSPITVNHLPIEICEAVHENMTLRNENGPIDSVWDVWCTPKNINTVIDEADGCLIVSGMAEYCVIFKNENGMPEVMEKAEAFEHRIPVDGISASASADVSITVPDCAYTISSSDAVSLKAELKICGCVSLASKVEAVTEVSFDENTKIVRDGDYALKLYYGVEGEDMWEVAKRYSTSVKAIMEENDLENEKLSDSGMLLIPII